MSYNLFLDDIRDPEVVTWVSLPKVEWTVVRSFKEFTDVLKKKGIPNYVAYDHDLCDQHYQPVKVLNQRNIDYNKYKEKTGYECCKYLVNECMKRGIKHPEFAVHSMNPVGARNIMDYVEQYNKDY